MTNPQKMQEGLEPIVYHCEWDTPETVPPGSHYGPVLRDVYILECNVSGYGTITINDRTFDVAPGDFYFLLPGQTITYTADHKDPRIALWCTAGGLRLGQALAAAGIDERAPFAPAECFDELLDVMKKLYTLRKNADMGSGFLQCAYMYELMGILTRGKAYNSADRFVQQAIGIMESGYHTGVTVADIAAEMGFDRCHFSTLFKQRVGSSPHAYLTSLRIAKAKALLAATDRSVAEVAESVGLDPRNFARLFKKTTGTTPNSCKKPPNGSSFD